MRILVLLVLAMAALAADAHESIDSAYDRFRALERSTLATPERERARRMARAYDRMFAARVRGGQLRDASTEDLRLLQLAAFSASYITLEDAYVADLALVVAELEARAAATPYQYRNLFVALVSTRKFAEAASLSSRHATLALEPLPDIRGSGDAAASRTVLVADPAHPGRMVRQPALPLDAGAQIVVVSHPQCHFSRNAAADILADPVLGVVFSHYARWLVPQRGNLGLDALRAWNRQHPGAPLALAYRQREWPMIDLWETPTFYFLQDGEVVRRVAGWPAGGRRDELLSALQEIGLVPAPSPAAGPPLPTPAN